MRALTNLARDGNSIAPILAQGTTAATSLLVQLVAAMALGLAEYGVFAVLLGLLVSATALHVGLVCDSLAVFDRHDRHFRASLVTSALTVGGLCVATTLSLLWVLGVGDIRLTLAYLALMLTRLAAETVRRTFIARVEFRALLLNDLSCLVFTVASLGTSTVIAGGVTLAGLILSMACGAFGAVLVGLAQLPSHEWRRLRPGVAALRQLVGFAIWRALQAGLRPVTLLGTRVLVGQTLSMAAVGALELARLVVAPLQVVLNGSSSLLLGRLAARARGGKGHDPGPVRSAARLLTVGTIFGGIALTAGAALVVPMLSDKRVDPVLTAGWVAYMTVWALTLPGATETVVRGGSRAVFVSRATEALLGAGMVLGALLLGISVVVLPWLLAAGGLYSVWRLRVASIARARHPGFIRDRA